MGIEGVGVVADSRNGTEMFNEAGPHNPYPPPQPLLRPIRCFAVTTLQLGIWPVGWSDHAGGVCTACTGRLKSPLWRLGNATGLIWRSCASALRLCAAVLSAMATLHRPWRHPVPGLVACAQCRNPRRVNTGRGSRGGGTAGVGQEARKQLGRHVLTRAQRITAEGWAVGDAAAFMHGPPGALWSRMRRMRRGQKQTKKRSEKD